MTFWRYKGTKVYNRNVLGTFSGHILIRNAIDNGTLSYNEIYLREGERLDIISAQEYGDSSYWWIIAAASKIGWTLQVTGGTILKIPDLESTLTLVYK